MLHAGAWEECDMHVALFSTKTRVSGNVYGGGAAAL